MSYFEVIIMSNSDYQVEMIRYSILVIIVIVLSARNIVLLERRFWCSPRTWHVACFCLTSIPYGAIQFDAHVRIRNRNVRFSVLSEGNEKVISHKWKSKKISKGYKMCESTFGIRSYGEFHVLWVHHRSSQRFRRWGDVEVKGDG